jgi:carboxymethylenebutenolidase
MAGEMVEFQSNGAKAGGYLARAEGGSGPGVVVIQEWWGLVEHVKEVCNRLAAEGFTALAPDLYHGRATKSPDEAGKMMMALDIERAERDLRGAVEYLATHEASAGEKVGTIGFCMGGVLSLFAAAKNPGRVGACVVFYGIHPKVNPPLEDLSVPVLGLYAERDEFVPPEAARALETKLKELGKEAQFHVYPGTDHAFFNDTRPEVYDPEAAGDAWRRTLSFLREHLG